MKISLTNIAGLDCRKVEALDQRSAVVLLHGYGASMDDLFPLWEMWHQENINWYFPNGPQRLPMGYYEGRSWFSIDIAALEKAMREGSHRDLAKTIPAEFDTTLGQLELFLNELKTRHQQIILGGFSQGAMCASHLSLKADSSLNALIVLSGNLLAEARFPKAAKCLPFYQSHGTMDPILPLEGARALEEKLLGLSFQGKLSIFQGGHEIPIKVINEVKEFIRQQLIA